MLWKAKHQIKSRCGCQEAEDACAADEWQHEHLIVNSEQGLWRENAIDARDFDSQGETDVPIFNIGDNEGIIQGLDNVAVKR